MTEGYQGNAECKAKLRTNTGDMRLSRKSTLAVSKKEPVQNLLLEYCCRPHHNAPQHRRKTELQSSEAQQSQANNPKFYTLDKEFYT